MDPDQYLRSEYEKHQAALAAKSRSEGNKGKEVMKINESNEFKETLGGPSKESDTGNEYFLHLHIKQLEERLEQSRLKEAENSLVIQNLMAQVDMLLTAKSQEHALSDSTPAEVSENPGPADRELRRMQKDKETLQAQLDDWKSKVSSVQANLQMQVYGQGQISGQPGQSQVDGNRNNAQRQVTPEIGYSKEKEAHIAAITFTSPIISLVTKLKSAISPCPLEEWFGKQVKYTFKCAGDGDFSKMVDGYRDFVDYIATEVQAEEDKMDENIKMVLQECEDFVNVLFEVDNMLE
jgi:hypothetical protein